MPNDSFVFNKNVIHENTIKSKGSQSNQLSGQMHARKRQHDSNSTFELLFKQRTTFILCEYKLLFFCLTDLFYLAD